MSSSVTRFVVCYSLGTGAGFDLQLAGLSRQLCEDFSEILALNNDFITVPQMLVVRETPDIDYNVAKNACAFAVFYSLPETKWILDATKAIGGDIALTGRIMDDETGLILSVNMVDVQTQNLLFCGCETCQREEIQSALARLGARILCHFTSRNADDWMNDVLSMVGTSSFHAYSNWMSLREVERRASREGITPPVSRMVEHLTYALSADPAFQKAGLKLCDVMAMQLERQNYELILRNLQSHALDNEAIAIVIVQCLARLGKRAEAENLLTDMIAKWSENGLFRLMRGCLSSDERQAARDLDEARILLGNDFNGCRSAVDNALLNVTGV